MPAYYEPDPLATPDRPVFRVTLPNGKRMPMAVSEEQLRQNGALPIRNEAPRDERLALGADMGGSTRSLVAPDETRPSQQFVRADSPQFTSMLARNEAAAESHGVARPNVDTSPEPSGESAAPAVSQVLQQPQQQYQSLDERARARQLASARRIAPREAGWVPQSMTQVVDNPISDEGKQAVLGADQGVIDANRALAERESAAARLEATELQNQADERRQQLRHEEQRQSIINEEVGRRMTDIAQRTQAVRDMPAPKATGLFASGNALGQIGGFLAVFMGGLGNRLGKGGSGQNLGVKGLEDGINRDIQQQRDALAKAGDDLSNAKGALADFTRIHGDPQMAEKELKLHQLEYVTARGNAMAARSKSDLVQANWSVKLQELEAAKARTASELERMQRGRIQTSAAYDPGSRGGVTMMSFDEARADVISGDAQENKYREQQGLDPKLYIPEANAYAMRDDDRVAIVAGNEAANKVRSQLGRLREIVTQEKQGIISGTQARQLFEQARAEAIGDTNKSKGFGAVDQGSMENLLGKMIPDYAMMSANPDAAYKQGQQNLTAAQREAYRQRGLRGGPAPGNMVTPVGQPLGVEKRGAGERGQ